MKLRHYLAIVIALAVLGGVGVTTYLGDAGEFGAMEVQALSDGGVQIHRGNSIIEVGESPEALEPQDVVVTTRKGLAQLNLESEERTAFLRENTRLRIRSTTIVEVQQGHVLASATDAPMEVRFDDVTARLSSALFRVDRGFGSTRAASYSGSVSLDSPGEERVELPRLFEVDIAAGDLPTAAVPYRLDPDDAWDIEYLNDAVVLSQQLEGLAGGFARQVGPSRPTLSYFDALTDADVRFMKHYLSRSVADLLVAFTIAENSDANFKRAFKRAFAYLDAGASYGIAAMILEADTNQLVAQLRRMIVRSGAVASDGGAGDSTFVLGSPVDSAPAPGDDPEEPGDTTVSGEVEGESHGDVSDCSDVIDCGVQDVEDQLPPGPGPGPGPSEEEEEDPDLPGTGDTSLLDGDLLNK